MDVLASVEYDPICTAVHRFNFPRTETICADAATLSAKTIKAAATKGWAAHYGDDLDWDGAVDVVVGGPPCQGFSLIGKRAFDDPRNQMVFTFARLVGTLKPRYFVMENVPGMTSVRAGEGPDAPLLIDLLIEEFEGFGFQVLSPVVLNAYSFGVPQDRRRMFLIGWRGADTTAPVAPVPQTRGRTRRGHPLDPKSGEGELALCPTVSDALGDLPDLDDFTASTNGDEIQLDTKQLALLEKQTSEYAKKLRGKRNDPNDLSYPRAWDRSLLTSSYRTVHAQKVTARFSKTEQGRPEPVSRFSRLHPDGVSSTLRAGTHYERGSFNAPRPIHPSLSRVISVREAARLHSFPDWFRLHWTKWHGFREIGNSLPPLLARAVAEQIVLALGTHPEQPESPLALGDRELLYLENVSAAKRFAADTSRMPRNALRSRQAPAVEAA